MKKLLQPKDRIFLVLAIIGDLAMFLHEEVGIGKMSLRSLYGWMPSGYKRGNFTQVVKRMLKTGYIEKVLKNGEPYLRLTSQGREVFKRDFLISAWQKKKWDRKWRLVIFDIEEERKKKRNYFQKKLKELGLGMIQKSVYLTPFDIALDLQEFIEAINLKAEVFVMEVNNILVGDDRRLAKKIWPLEMLNKKYEKVLERLEEIKKIKSRHQRKAWRELKDNYLKVLAKDPCLPRELLPENWLGEKARKLAAEFN